MFRIKTVVIPIILMASWFQAGCGASFLAPMKTSPATLGTTTQGRRELMEMPVPKEKIVAAVYKFRDQTGQYKPGGSWSTAVTQGATSILIRALEESKWFVVIEREGLSSLLNERQIIRTSRMNYTNGKNGEDQSLIPPLLFAGVLLEGGIISYDSNVLTGGAGIKYFGLGASGEYREDRVTVYLRAISTQSGQILKTVYTSKTILSQAVDVGLFRFVKFKRLLETETGFTYNEPPELAVTEAIEKAVKSLIIEGMMDKLWLPADTSQINAQVVREYLEEKSENLKADNFGRELVSRDRYSIGIDLGGQMYSGDYSHPIFRPVGGFNLEFPLGGEASLNLNISQGQLAASRAFQSTLSRIELSGNLYLLPSGRFTPFLSLGIAGSGLVAKDKYGDELESGKNWIASVSAGAGLDYMLTNKFGLNFLFTNQYYFSDAVDGLRYGSYNDNNWSGRFGLRFYPGR